MICHQCLVIQSLTYLDTPVKHCLVWEAVAYRNTNIKLIRGALIRIIHDSFSELDNPVLSFYPHRLFSIFHTIFNFSCGAFILLSSSIIHFHFTLIIFEMMVIPRTNQSRSKLLGVPTLKVHYIFHKHLQFDLHFKLYPYCILQTTHSLSY